MNRFLEQISFAILAIAVLSWNVSSAQEVQKLDLWNGHAALGNGESEPVQVELTVYPASDPNGAAAVICPGGGYGGHAIEAEGHGIARWLNRHGVTGVVLKYRLPRGRHQVPLLDAQRAMRLTRSKAEEWKIDPKKVGIIGFSAGGHLASTAATHFDEGDAQASDPVSRQSCRPDFAILVYPVITMSEKTHGGSRTNLLGANPSQKLIDLYSNEKQVTEKTPPIFLAHPQDDTVVVPANSQMMADALEQKKIPSKYLQLESGGHGLNGYKGPMWDAWQAQSLEWLAGLKLIPANDAATR